jgi:hypothetical protein
LEPYCLAAKLKAGAQTMPKMPGERDAAALQANGREHHPLTRERGNLMPDIAGRGMAKLAGTSTDSRQP